MIIAPSGSKRLEYRFRRADQICSVRCALAAHASPVLLHKALTPRLSEAARALSHCSYCDTTEGNAFDAAAMLESGLKNVGFNSQLREPLIDDAAELGALYADVAETKKIRIRIEAIDDDGCSKFHCDNVTLRLLRTYVGPGAQWVPLDRREDALRLQGLYEGPVHSIPTGALAFFFPGALSPLGGVAHRSPPIENTGVRRLIIVIDASGALR